MYFLSSLKLEDYFNFKLPCIEIQCLLVKWRETIFLVSFIMSWRKTEGSVVKSLLTDEQVIILIDNGLTYFNLRDLLIVILRKVNPSIVINRKWQPMWHFVPSFIFCSQSYLPTFIIELGMLVLNGIEEGNIIIRNNYYYIS